MKRLEHPKLKLLDKIIVNYWKLLSEKQAACGEKKRHHCIR